MSITTIIGPMFSGKTSELIRLIDRKKISGKKCLIIKHELDNRFDKVEHEPAKLLTQFLDPPVTLWETGSAEYPVKPDTARPLQKLIAPSKVEPAKLLKHVTTHSAIRYCECDIDYLSELNLAIAMKYFAAEYQVIGIEEGFFFKGINEFCNELANRDVEVIVATLESSYRQELFIEIGNLIANSEYVTKLTAICMKCKNRDASFNIRTIKSDQEILVGGNDMYQCVCRKCLIIFNQLQTHDT
jgi:thymidine kinase